MITPAASGRHHACDWAWQSSLPHPQNVCWAPPGQTNWWRRTPWTVSPHPATHPPSWPCPTTTPSTCGTRTGWSSPAPWTRASRTARRCSLQCPTSPSSPHTAPTTAPPSSPAALLLTAPCTTRFERDRAPHGQYCGREPLLTLWLHTVNMWIRQPSSSQDILYSTWPTAWPQESG